MREGTISIRERLLIALPWASIPLLAMHFASTWNELPARVATHFDLQGRANGWQSPQTLATFAFGSLILVLAVFTVAMLRAFRLSSMTRVLTVFVYLIAGINFTMFWQLLDHAAYGRPMSQMWPVPLIFPVLALLAAIVLLAQFAPVTQAPTSVGTLIAEEQHRSLLQLFFIAPGILIGFWLAARGLGVPRLLGIFLVAVMAWVGIAVLDGFRYFVRSDGVQIKGFLMPLRFIPRSTIRSYRTQPWTGLGYGIRLTSTGTAYIWGGRNVVNIATDSGDVMLGHEHPERLIQDLDRMMQTAR